MIGRVRVAKRILAHASAGAVLLLAANVSSAQAQVDFGLTAGPTIADFTGSYVDHSIRTWGVTGGLFVEWHLSRHWSLEGAFSFGQMGAFEVESPLHEESYDYRTAYVLIPVAAVYRTGFFGEKWDFRAFAGGAPALNTGCDVKPSAQFSFDEECGAETPGGEVADSDILIQFGVGVDRVFGGGSGFGFDARYSVGTKNLWSDAVDGGLTAKNGVLDLKFRFFLPLQGPRQ
jgi:hypothetical protein